MSRSKSQDDDGDDEQDKKKAPQSSLTTFLHPFSSSTKGMNTANSSPQQPSPQQPLSRTASQADDDNLPIVALASLPQQNPPPHDRKKTTSSLPPPFVMQVTAIASLGGILFGYDMGVISGALPQLATDFDLDNGQQELVVSILYVGGGLGAAFGGTLCDRMGRKRSILWTDVCFIVGAAILAGAPALWVVVVGRIVVGFAVAVSGIADVSYLHEIAPLEWRGAIVSVNEACISLGFLFAFVAGNLLSRETALTTGEHPQGWRVMFGLGGVLAAIQLVGMWPMPESPVWLKDQGRLEESSAALRRIHGHDKVPDYDEESDDIADCNGYNSVPSPPRSTSSLAENPSHTVNKREPTKKTTKRSGTTYDSLSSTDVPPAVGASSVDPAASTPMQSLSMESLPETVNTVETTTTSRGPPQEMIHQLRLGWHKLTIAKVQFQTVCRKYYRQVWIALFLSVAQQFCGQTNVLNYAPTILKGILEMDNSNNQQGNDTSVDDQLSDWATLSIGLVKFIVTVLVIWKIEVVGRRFMLLFGMGTIAFGLLLVAVAFSTNREVVVQSGSGFYFALPGVLMVVSGYSMSFGPLTWLLTSELFPTDIRGRALGASTIVTYLCAAMVTYSFLTAQAILGTSVVFSIYMLITVAGIIFACMAIPDTGNKTIGEIDTELSQMPCWNKPSSKKWPNAQSGAPEVATPDRLLRSVSGSSSDRLIEGELT